MDTRVIKFFLIVGVIGFGVYKYLEFTSFAWAPFCIIDNTKPEFLSKHCTYNYYDECQRDKIAGQRCSSNPNAMATRKGDKNYCVLSSEGMDCVFSNKAKCISTSKNFRGACMVNTKSAAYKNRMRK